MRKGMIDYEQLEEVGIFLNTKKRGDKMNFYKKLNRLNWGLLIFWLLALGGCLAFWYFVIYWFVKLIARGQ